MKKKLPGIFQGEKNATYSNMQEKCYCSIEEERKENIIKKENTIQQSRMSIDSKIMNIFNAPNYVYKADVKITLKDQIVEKTIVGRTAASLITIENELIPISDILDII